MREVFGDRTILLLGVVFWAEGFKTFGQLAIVLFYKDDLNLQPGETQMLRLVTYIAWFIKPIYGMISDNIPLFGTHRKFYLLFSGVLGISCSLSILFYQQIVVSVIALMLSEFSQAISDVVADAVMVEEARKDPVGGSGTLQSYSWTILSIGGLIGSPFGGFLLEFMKPNEVIGLVSICPGFLILGALILNEEKTENRVSCEAIETEISNLCFEVREERIYKPMLFIFLSNAISPSFYSLMIYFYTDEVGLTTEFLGFLNTIGYLGLVIASIGYNAYIKPWSYRKALFLAQICEFLACSIDLGLVLKLYLYLGVPPEIFAIGDNIIGNMIVWAFKSMPLYVLTAKICPKGLEASFFAAFASVFNISFAVSEWYGGILCEVFGVKKDEYGLLWLLVLIEAVGRLLVIPFIRLLPSFDNVTEEEQPIIELQTQQELEEKELI